MADFFIHPYFTGSNEPVRNIHTAKFIRRVIKETIIEDELNYDDESVADAVEVIYPIVAIIVFNTKYMFETVKEDKEKLVNLISILSEHLL